MTERNLRADVDRGRRAEHELVETQAAFQAVEEALLRTWRETPIGADAKVMKLHMSMHNLAAVKAVFFRTIRAGKDAEAMLLAAQAAVSEEGLTSLQP